MRAHAHEKCGEPAALPSTLLPSLFDSALRATSQTRHHAPDFYCYAIQ